MTYNAGEDRPAGRNRGAVLLVGSLVAVIAAGAAWYYLHGERQSVAPPTASDSTPGKSGMADMPGMTMGTDGSAMLTPMQIAQFGVTFGAAELRELRGTLRTVGTVSVDETGVVAVTTKFGGFVERLNTNITGQAVRAGDVMAAIYSPELVTLQEELLLAQRLDGAAGGSASSSSGERSLLSSARRRLRLLDVSDAQIDEVLRTKQPLRTTNVVAPASGILTERQVAQGQSVQAGMPMFTISDLSRVWIDVRIPSASGSSARVGALASFTLAGLPGRTFSGRVSYLYPTVGEETRTLSARVVVRNDDRALKPGMFTNVVIESPGRRALTVPRTAVIETGERAIVFVDMGGGRLMPHDVEIGVTTSDLAEILSGLEPGQRVVTSAQFLLESESNLAEVMRSMIGMGGAADMKEMKGMDMTGKKPTSPPKH